MNEKSSYPAYCDNSARNGLTCFESDLEFIAIAKDYKSETSITKEVIYQCRKCQGFYKHCYSSVYETRNFDCEEGWWTPVDRYFKVEEIYGNNPALPLKEARKYGYKGEDFTWKANRCNYGNTPSGLTCRAGSIKFLAWASPEKTDSYDDKIFKCKRCGQLYKQIWIQKIKFNFYKAAQSDFFPLDEARRFGYTE